MMLAIFGVIGLVQKILLQLLSKDSIGILITIAVFGWIAWIFILTFSVSANMRRLHDIELSGWLVLLTLIPFLNVLFFIYLASKSGTFTANKYGELPPRRKFLSLILNN